MKLFAGLFLSVYGLFAISACNNSTQSSSTADTTQVKTDTVSSGSTAGFKLGVQMWTFRMFSFTDALNKVDSAGIKYIEAFFGQKLGDGMKGSFGTDMTADSKEKLKQLLQAKG